MRGRKRSRKTREQDPRMSLRAICAPSSLSQIAPPIPPTVEKLACLSSQDVDTLLHEWGRAGVVTAYKCGADERGANNHIFKVLEAGGCRLTNVFGGLETSTGRNDGMCLWKWSLALFGTHPHDLFSWGLRYSTYDWDHGKILEGLCAILPHSVWNHDIANLRFALQMAVYLRIKDHVLPIGPLPKPIRDGILEYYTDDSLLAARVAFDAWQRLRFQSEDAISRLVAKMKELPRGQDPPQIFLRDEERVFYLRSCDVTHLMAALDSLHSNGDPDFTHSVFTYHHRFARQTLDFWHNLEPTSRGKMEEWDRICIGNKYRDAIKGHPDIPYSERAVYQKLSHWGTELCDRRVKLSLFDDYHRLCHRQAKQEYLSHMFDK